MVVQLLLPIVYGHTHNLFNLNRNDICRIASSSPSFLSDSTSLLTLEVSTVEKMAKGMRKNLHGEPTLHLFFQGDIFPISVRALVDRKPSG